jgi:hypothetical protein
MLALGEGRRQKGKERGQRGEGERIEISIG